ncbi:MAG TPA: hypothetical protein VLS85_12540, partial [Hanamia sp.]|nr:hypothetical protein [Hanamia sp.]
MKNQFRKIGIAWNDRAKAAMENLASRARKGETLVQTASREMDNFYDQLKTDKKIRFNTEDQIAMHFLKIATEQEMAKQAEYAQNNDDYTSINSLGAQVLDEQHNRVNAVLGAMRSESGVGLGYGNVEARLHPDYGLQVRQMQMIKANNGEPLSEETQQFVKDQWEKEKELMKREQEVKEESMKADFDRQISELQKQYEAKLKITSGKPKTVKEKTSSKLRDFAKGLRTSDEFDKFIKSSSGDITKAGFIPDISLKEALANASEHLADLLDKGEELGKAIKEAAKKFKGDLDETDFTKLLTDFYNRASLPDKDAALQSIKDLADENKDTSITPDMVSNNHIRDYVNSFIGESDQKDLLNDATKGLKEVLPDVTKKQLIEAYLKKGDFQPETKRQLKTWVKEQQDELKKIAKKELTADQQQKIKLQAEKQNAIKKRDDFQKKLDNLEKTGVLEGAVKEPAITLKKEDAELININRELAKIESSYREKQAKVRDKANSTLYKVADFGRSLWVDYLIGSPVTLAKIAWMGFIKPTTDVARRIAFGHVFYRFSPEISEAAKRGGESSSWRTIKSMANAYFRQKGQEGLKRLYEKGENDYYDAFKKYSEYASSDNPDAKKLANLKKDMDNKMFITQGNFMHQFIGGSSILDAYHSFINRLNYIEEQFGNLRPESLA